MARWSTQAANTALTLASSPEHRRLTGLRDLAVTQRALLAGLLRRNASTRYGRDHGFALIAGPDDFRRAVPLSRWDDYADDVGRIAAGEPGVLTTERVRLLEPSSGSTAAVKLIPYTASLKAEYQRGLLPWLHDLYTTHPGLRRGRSYWSVTPPATRPAPESVVPVGFDSDAAYFGPLGRRLVSTVFAVPASVAATTDMDAFLDATCVHLLAADDLALVSVWNPTLFTILLDRMRERADALLPRLGARRRRAVAGAVRADDWAAVWPRLRVVSAWADAAAAGPAAALASRLPGVVLQPKGLLATEGFVSLPLEAAGGAVLSARSHVFEFVPVPDADGPDPAADATTLLAHELEVGRRYEVVLTTGGGLYRYRLGDVVEVTGHHGVLPVLRFTGRADRVSDLVGEKLSEAFVLAALAAAGAPADAVLAAASDHYELRTDPPDAALAARVDAGLRAGFHYDHARRLGQLRPVRAVSPPMDAAGRLASGVATGVRLGDIKPTALA